MKEPAANDGKPNIIRRPFVCSHEQESFQVTGPKETCVVI